MKFYILLIIIILLVILLSISKYNTLQQKLFYKCENILNNTALNNSLEKNNIVHTTNINDKWDIYIPCGYNFVEDEISRINPVKIPATSDENIIDIINNSTNNSTNNSEQINLNISENTKSNTAIYAIPGCDKLASKNKLWELLVKRYGVSRASSIMPMSYLVDSQEDMTNFAELFRKTKLQYRIYILKKNIQRKQGLEIIDCRSNNNNKYSSVSEIIKYARENEFKVIQTYITSPLLINKRKLNIRLYVLILCNQGTNIPTAYIYKQGKCIYTNTEYNSENSENIESQITSINLDTNIYNTNPETLLELGEYIGYNRWNSIWTNICNKLRNIIIAVEPVLCKGQNTQGYNRFQLFGVDVIISTDNNSNKKYEPYILEFNKGPDMSFKTDNDEKMKNELQSDILSLIGFGSNGTHGNSNWEMLIS